MNFYFDTSALNYFMTGRNSNDAAATRCLQESKGRRFRFSSVGIWEILLTSDPDRREDIISFAQNLLDPELVPSPEEILINYINAGCPAQEPKYPFASTADLATVWADLCKDPAKTFVYSQEHLQTRTRQIRELSRDLQLTIQAEGQVILPPDLSMGLNLNRILTHLRIVDDPEKIDIPERKVCMIAIFYIIVIVCAGLGFDNAPVERFWKSIGADSMGDRIHYIFHQHPELVHRGPLQNMALATYYQCKGRFSRGMFFDSLHSIYLTYLDLFLTADDHFRILRDSVDFPSFKRIQIIGDDVALTSG